ncbi:MAG: hypothetical protein LBI49_06325 [Nocardiopsaceae bacterium]|jgi:hypothetical protein|nr:hypothetical protein [Nocardiopsaceae bacterium]
MTQAQQGTPAPAPSAPAASAARLAALRGNCMGAAVLFIIQLALGMGLNLFVTLPEHGSFFGTVSGSAVLIAHVVVALLLLGAAGSALVRAIRARRAIVYTSLGLAAVLAAGIAGSSFVASAADGASFGMALATAVGMFCYLAAVFTLR